MGHWRRVGLAVFLLMVETSFVMAKIPSEFISLTETCPNIIIQSDYSTVKNFTGEVVRGYKKTAAYMAKAPAQALGEVQKVALARGYNLKIFDGYRPVKAVEFFQEWAKRPETNPEIKAHYYPTFSRLDLFEQGFIAKQSSHSRGAAVDLTLVNLKTGKELDMGSHFDFFDERSNTDSKNITEEQRKNRMLLKELMEGKGFKNFSQEWWHFSFKPEPYPEKSFDFDVE